MSDGCGHDHAGEPQDEPAENGLENCLEYGSIVIKYFLTPGGDPIVQTTILEDDQGNRPSYFEAIAMHVMARDSIDKIYGVS